MIDRRSKKSLNNNNNNNNKCILIRNVKKSQKNKICFWNKNKICYFYDWNMEKPLTPSLLCCSSGPPRIPASLHAQSWIKRRWRAGSATGGVLGEQAQTLLWSAKFLKVLSLARLWIRSGAHKTVCLHHWFLLKGYGPSSGSSAASRQANSRTWEHSSRFPAPLKSHRKDSRAVTFHFCWILLPTKWHKWSPERTQGFKCANNAMFPKKKTNILDE